MNKFMARMSAKNVLRALHPSFLSLKYFCFGWTHFLWAELTNLIILFSAVYALQKVFLFNKLRLWLYWACVLGYRKFMAGVFSTNADRLNGYTVVMTGATSGIGREVARQLTIKGAHIVIASRDLEKAEELKKDLLTLKGSVETRYCDLSSLKSVRDFAEGLIQHKYHLHMLVNIAGEMLTPASVTEDGLEHQMAVNHLGHFLMTNMLLPWLTHNRTSKIINVSSTAHIEGDLAFGHLKPSDPNFNKWKAFCNSQLATALFSRELRNRLKDTNIQVFTANPGIAHTSFYRNMLPSFVYEQLFKFLLPTPLEAAQTITYCATRAQPQDVYYSECSPGWPSDSAMDDDLARKWWKESEKLVGLDK